MAAGNVRKQGAMRGRGGRWCDVLSVALGGGKAAGQQANGGGFHVSLAAGDLAGKAPAAVSSQPQCLIEQFGRIQKCIAVKPAQAGEFRLLHGGNSTEDPDLLAVFKLGLEANHVEQRAEPVVLPELDNCIWLVVWIVRIGKAEWLHGPMPRRFGSALGHHLNWQTAVEIGCVRFPLMEACLVAGQ